MVNKPVLERLKALKRLPCAIWQGIKNLGGRHVVRKPEVICTQLKPRTG